MFWPTTPLVRPANTCSAFCALSQGCFHGSILPPCTLTCSRTVDHITHAMDRPLISPSLHADQPRTPLTCRAMHPLSVRLAALRPSPPITPLHPRWSLVFPQPQPTIAHEHHAPMDPLRQLGHSLAQTRSVVKHRMSEQKNRYFWVCLYQQGRRHS